MLLNLLIIELFMLEAVLNPILRITSSWKRFISELYLAYKKKHSMKLS